MNRALGVTAIVAAATAAFAGNAARSEPLVLEAKVSLGNIHGRIDHLAIDVARLRLYVAELGNDSVGVVDLNRRALMRTLKGFHEPQGIAYEPATDTVYVANGGDGSVRLFRGADLATAGVIELGTDADNVRADSAAHRVVVGYGSGALAVIDPVSRKKIADIPLKAHPESFQMEAAGPRIFVNVPDAHEIAVVDRNTAQQTASWTTQDLRANFPLAVDDTNQQILVMFRHPSKLGVFRMRDGAMLHALDACEDADDVFVDARRGRVYVSCGEGFIEVWAVEKDGYLKLAHLATAVGSRTALFVPEVDRLLLAVRATATEPAAIWIFRALF